jgi:hypothetical protein
MDVWSPSANIWIRVSTWALRGGSLQHPEALLVDRIVPNAAQFCRNLVEQCLLPLVLRLPPELEALPVPLSPADMRETKKVVNAQPSVILRTIRLSFLRILKCQSASCGVTCKWLERFLCRHHTLKRFM